MIEANLDDVKWATKSGRFPASLPDGTEWTADTDLERFTNRDHPKFKETRELINAIRESQGHEVFA